MAIDSILHLLIGGILSILFFAMGMKGYQVLAGVSGLAFFKEVYDHNFVLNHFYPLCMDEHMSDFGFSIVLLLFLLPLIGIYLDQQEMQRSKSYA